MPNSIRTDIRRRLKGCSNELEHILSVLSDIGELHREHHLDITHRYEVVFKLTLQVKELVDQFYDAA